MLWKELHTANKTSGDWVWWSQNLPSQQIESIILMLKWVLFWADVGCFKASISVLILVFTDCSSFMCCVFKRAAEHELEQVQKEKESTKNATND